MTREQARDVVFIPILAWAGLCVCLAATAIYANLPHAPLKVVVGPGISGLKALIIATWFMRLDRSGALVRFTAAVGPLWLSFMFLLGFADYVTRQFLF